MRKAQQHHHPLFQLIELLDKISSNTPPRGNGKHKHKCPQCSHIWEHAENCFDKTKEHTCTQCGTEQWFRYYGEPPRCPAVPRRVR